MHEIALLKYHWPEYPARFDPGIPPLILLTLPAGTSRTIARLHARELLLTISAQLPRLGTEQPALLETPNGPKFSGSDLQISLSYSGDKVLIGLSCNSTPGVDIVAIDRLSEIEAVSALYLPKSACQTVLNAPDDRRTSSFALAWAQLESCCKALSLPLAEIDSSRELAYASCQLIDCEQIDGYSIALALGPNMSHVGAAN